MLNRKKTKQKVYKADLLIFDRPNYYYDEGEDYDDSSKKEICRHNWNGKKEKQL